jgi:D-alanyl-lipoteichoic acid acyltransferase DltB (MBOAT superfamily)
MEFIQHFMYVVAIKDTKAWTGDSSSEIGMIGFWSLMIVWLKVRRLNSSLSLDSGTHSYIAFASMALFPTLGLGWWYRRAREYGPVYGE